MTIPKLVLLQLLVRDAGRLVANRYYLKRGETTEPIPNGRELPLGRYCKRARSEYARHMTHRCRRPSLGKLQCNVHINERIATEH